MSINLQNCCITYDMRKRLKVSTTDFIDKNFPTSFNFYENYWHTSQKTRSDLREITSEKSLSETITEKNESIALIHYQPDDREINILKTSARGLPYRQKFLGYLTKEYLDHVHDPQLEKTYQEKYVFHPLNIRYIKEIETTNKDTEETESINIYSEYSETTLKYFNSAVDLTALELPFTNENINQIKQRQSEYARINRFSGWTEKKTVKIDNVGSFSCGFDGKLSKEYFLNAIGANKVKVIKINSLYRGGSGEASINLTEAKGPRIAKGGYVFPYLSKLPTLNQETCEIEYRIYFCLGLFENLEKIIKYKRARAFIPELLESIEMYDGLKLFQPEAYEKKMAEMYGPHLKYWDGVSTLFQRLPEDAIVKEIENKDKIQPKHLSYLQSAATVIRSNESQEHGKIKNAYNEIDTKLKTIQDNIVTTTSDITYYKEDIKTIQYKLDRLTTAQQERTTNLSRMENDLQGYTEAHITLKTQYEESNTSYQDYLKETINSIDIETSDNLLKSKEWISNLEKTGIIINNIFYYDVAASMEISLIDKPELALEIIENDSHDNPNYILHRVQFCTTKPIIIRVDYGRDGEECRKIVGGPYNITVTNHSISVSLKSTSGCFGINKSSIIAGDYCTAWIHPHTQSFSLNLVNWERYCQSLLERETNGCLGEGAPTLRNAFLANSPKQAIFAAMTWLSSANSSDAWGKHWKYFPKLSNVNIDGQHDAIIQTEKDSAPLVTTEDGMDQIAEIAEDLIANLDNILQPIIPEEPIIEDEGISDHEEVEPVPVPTTTVRYIVDGQYEMAAATSQNPIANTSPLIVAQVEEQLHQAGRADYRPYIPIRPIHTPVLTEDIPEELEEPEPALNLIGNLYKEHVKEFVNNCNQSEEITAPAIERNMIFNPVNNHYNYSN